MFVDDTIIEQDVLLEEINPVSFHKLESIRPIILRASICLSDAPTSIR